MVLYLAVKCGALVKIGHFFFHFSHGSHYCGLKVDTSSDKTSVRRTKFQMKNHLLPQNHTKSAENISKAKTSFTLFAEPAPACWVLEAQHDQLGFFSLKKNISK